MTLVKTATVVSSVVAFLLLVVKMFVGLYSGSIAVISSAIDSLLDLFVSIFNFFAVKNAEKNSDEIFNYGRGKIEALASFIEGLIITISGIFIFYQSVLKVISGEKVEYITISIYIMLFSIVLTGGLVSFLNYVGKKTNNLVIKSDALHYKMDLLSNGGIILALAIIHFTGFHIIDGIIGIIISIYIIYSSYDLIKTGFLLILDASIKKEEVDKIKNIFSSEECVRGYHFLRTRESGKFNFIQAHLVFNLDIKLIDAHRISDKIEDKIKQIDANKTWIIDLHLDPYDDSKIDMQATL